MRISPISSPHEAGRRECSSFLPRQPPRRIETPHPGDRSGPPAPSRPDRTPDFILVVPNEEMAGVAKDDFCRISPAEDLKCKLAA